MGVALVKLVGLLGMAWALLVSQVVTAGAIIPAYTCRVIGLPFCRFLREGIVPGLVAAIPALIAGLAMRCYLPPSHVAHMLAQAACVGLITGASVFFVCLGRELRIDVLHSFMRKQPTSLSIRKEPVPDNPGEPCE